MATDETLKPKRQPVKPDVVNTAVQGAQRPVRAFAFEDEEQWLQNEAMRLIEQRHADFMTLVALPYAVLRHRRDEARMRGRVLRWYADPERAYRRKVQDEAETRIEAGQHPAFVFCLWNNQPIPYESYSFYCNDKCQQAHEELGTIYSRDFIQCGACHHDLLGQSGDIAQLPVDVNGQVACSHLCLMALPFDPELTPIRK